MTHGGDTRERRCGGAAVAAQRHQWRLVRAMCAAVVVCALHGDHLGRPSPSVLAEAATNADSVASHSAHPARVRSLFKDFRKIVDTLGSDSHPAATHSLIEETHFPEADELPEVDLDRFPLFALTTPVEVVLRPGDALYIPTLWFHWCFNDEDSTSVNVWFHSEVAADELKGANGPRIAEDAARALRARMAEVRAAADAGDGTAADLEDEQGDGWLQLLVVLDTMAEKGELSHVETKQLLKLMDMMESIIPVDGDAGGGGDGAASGLVLPGGGGEDAPRPPPMSRRMDNVWTRAFVRAMRYNCGHDGVDCLGVRPEPPTPNELHGSSSKRRGSQEERAKRRQLRPGFLGKPTPATLPCEHHGAAGAAVGAGAGVGDGATVSTEVGSDGAAASASPRRLLTPDDAGRLPFAHQHVLEYTARRSGGDGGTHGDGDADDDDAANGTGGEGIDAAAACGDGIPGMYTLLAKHLAWNRPFVARDAASAWPALHLWRNRTLVEQTEGGLRFCKRSASERITPGPPVRNLAWAERQNPNGTFHFPADTLADAHAYRDAHPGHAVMCQVDLDDDIVRGVGFGADVRPGLPFMPDVSGIVPHEANMWYSLGRECSGLHFDTYENVLVQVRGTKRVLMFPPEQFELLYVRG